MRKKLYLILVPLVFLVYAGCSQMSLVDLMESEQEGEFSLGIESVNLKAGSQFNFKSVGGYLPYSYAVKDGTDTGDIDPATGMYAAPETESEVTVESRDRLGHRDSARVVIYESIEADPATFSIHLDDSPQAISLIGGIGSLLASAELGEISPSEPVESGDVVTYSPPAATGTDYIEVIDELDNSLSIRVEVLADTDDIVLEILPTDTVLNPGDSQEFTITNTTGHDLSIALSDSFGSIDEDEVDDDETNASVEYSAPGTEGSVFLTVTDDNTGDSVQADISVQAEETALEITPGNVEVSPGSTVEFTASGGVPPYVFTRLNGSGTLEQTSPTTASATSTSMISMIRVTDNVGNQAKGKIKAK